MWGRPSPFVACHAPAKRQPDRRQKPVVCPTFAAQAWIGCPTRAILNPMAKSEITRRVFVGGLTALGLSAADDGWVQLFDGRSLDGWRPSENKSSWKVVEGQLAAEGPRSHLFYTGPVRGADFRNFELEVEVLTRPACNSGVYFHTAYQESDFPYKGFEVQINNTATGEGSYRERKK